jgi:hypothetical protein
MRVEPVASFVVPAGTALAVVEPPQQAMLMFSWRPNSGRLFDDDPPGWRQTQVLRVPQRDACRLMGQPAA